MDRLGEAAHGDGLPITWVAVAHDALIGSASLVARTIVRQDLSPWLSSVYVAPQYRHQAIGSTLVRHVERSAAKLGFARLHLFTPDREALYARLGWTLVETTEHSSRRLAIMARTLLPGGSEA
jgi:N-acetylglutamate synthase-like GNAT family acetyltransferase